MKKVMIIGVGAQGSTIAKRLNEEENVSQIICADYDLKAAEELGNSLEKAVAVQVNANDVKDIIKAADNADIIVNHINKLFLTNKAKAAVGGWVNYSDSGYDAFLYFASPKGENSHTPVEINKIYNKSL